VLEDLLKKGIPTGATQNTNSINTTLYRPLSFDSSLLCVSTAFKSVLAHGENLGIDLKGFHEAFYKLLLDLPSHYSDETISSALDTLQLMIYQIKQVSMSRLGSFVKRTGITLLNLHSGNQSLGFGALVLAIFLKYPKIKVLLESERERPTSSMVDLETHDPELSNALETSLWEIALLLKHYHPQVVEIFRVISKLSDYETNNTTPPTVLGQASGQLKALDILTKFSTENGSFPVPPKPNPHPLASRYAKLMKNEGDDEKGFFYKPSVLFRQSEFFDEHILPHTQVMEDDQYEQLVPQNSILPTSTIFEEQLKLYSLRRRSELQFQLSDLKNKLEMFKKLDLSSQKNK